MEIGNPYYRYFLPLYKPYKIKDAIIRRFIQGSKPLFADYYDPLAIPTEELFRKIDSFNPRKDEDVLEFCNTFGLPGFREAVKIKKFRGFLYNIERGFSEGQFYLRKHYRELFTIAAHLSHLSALELLQIKANYSNTFWSKSLGDKLKKAKSIDEYFLSDPCRLSDFIFSIKDFRQVPNLGESEAIVDFQKDGVFFQDIEDVRQDIRSFKSSIRAFLNKEIKGTDGEKLMVWDLKRYLEGLQTTLSYNPEGGKVHSYIYSTFAQALGVHFLEANLSETKYRRCEYDKCGKPIKITHGRQRFCPLNGKDYDWSFHFRHIKDWKVLLSNLHSSKSPIDKHIVSLLNEKCKEIIYLWEPKKGIDKESKHSIIHGLNQVLKSREFYDKKVFSDLRLKEEYSQLLIDGIENLDAEDVEMLNRILFDSIYSNKIVKKHNNRSKCEKRHNDKRFRDGETKTKES